ncbi:hypothetical protein Q1695_005090 [Nippostrongylus brasiliensis]|nr:hypothetical protein Q1695_005090 [Nippostrongylus brasiliensis]
MRHIVGLLLAYIFVGCSDCRGISRQKPPTEWRAFDAPLAGIPCKAPGNQWRTASGIVDACGNLIKSSISDQDSMNSAKTPTLPKRTRECKPPDVLKTLPAQLQERILAIWRERDPSGDCWKQQRRTRLILLNLPPSLRKSFRPPALECSLPHFIDRLEWDLQVQLRRLWTGYKKGQNCSEIVAQQLRLLQQHDISLESFDMPPADIFRRYQLIQKLRQSNRA